jgi:hypothetical protein
MAVWICKIIPFSIHPTHYNLAGDKCKFSHDLNVERKTEKRSIYCDMRDLDGGTETMEDWTEEKLKDVVEKKQRAGEKTMPTTTIVREIE